MVRVAGLCFDTLIVFLKAVSVGTWFLAARWVLYPCTFFFHHASTYFSELVYGFVCSISFFPEDLTGILWFSSSRFTHQYKDALQRSFWSVFWPN